MCFLSFADDVTVTEINVLGNGDDDYEEEFLAEVTTFYLGRVWTKRSTLFEAAPRSSTLSCWTANVV